MPSRAAIAGLVGLRTDRWMAAARPRQGLRRERPAGLPRAPNRSPSEARTHLKNSVLQPFELFLQIRGRYLPARNAAGVTPTSLPKDVVKWLWVLYPTSNATSVIGNLVSASSSFARLTRQRTMYW
jgi:hypothetical protein